MSESKPPKVFESLSVHRQALVTNPEETARLHPLTAMAGELVHQGWSALTDQHTKVGSSTEAFLSEDTRWKLVAMAHGDWILAYILTSAGQRSAGASMSRRAVEYLAYAAKIGRRSDRAQLYLNQVPGYLKGDELAKVKADFGKFNIPKAYSSQEYNFLWPLLGWWEHCSEWGVHANFATFVDRARKDGQLRLTDEPQDIPRHSALMVCVGFWMLKAAAKILDDTRVNPATWAKTYAAIEDATRKMRVDLGQNAMGLSPGLIRDIHEDKNEKLIEGFQAALKRGQKPPPKKQDAKDLAEAARKSGLTAAQKKQVTELLDSFPPSGN